MRGIATVLVLLLASLFLMPTGTSDEGRTATAPYIATTFETCVPVKLVTPPGPGYDGAPSACIAVVPGEHVATVLVQDESGLPITAWYNWIDRGDAYTGGSGAFCGNEGVELTVPQDARTLSITVYNAAAPVGLPDCGPSAGTTGVVTVTFA